LSDLLSNRPPEAHRAADLTRRAIALIRQRDWEHAEAVLAEALSLAPDDPINLYNLACVTAQRGDPAAAIECLERAAAAGFGDFNLIARDPDLAPARGLPRFTAFMEARDEWQRQGAQRLLAGLRARFGDRYEYSIDPEQKLIFATHVDEDSLADLKETLAAQARGQARDLFANKPDAYVSVVVPSASDYRKIMRLKDNVGGAYFDATKTLVAQKPGEVMRHEFTHALHAADRAPLGQDHAPWVVEGLGVLYESSEKLFTEDGDVLVPVADNARLPVAAAAARRKSLVPLSRFLAMSPGEFLQRPNVTYAQAGGLMFYLRDRGLLKKFYETYKQTWDADPTGRVALERVSGMTIGEFESAWTKWLADRPPEPFFGAAALFLGARVAPVKGGMTVIAVAPNGPAADAGIEPRDLILQVNGQPVPDYASLRPAVGPYKPGRTIVLKVRRGAETWDAPVKLANVSSAPAQMAPQ
jgi:tetratricopeptide (TPR) repeat protein